MCDFVYFGWIGIDMVCVVVYYGIVFLAVFLEFVDYFYEFIGVVIVLIVFQLFVQVYGVCGVVEIIGDDVLVYVVMI